MSRDVDKLLRLTQKAFEEYVDAGEHSDQDTIDLWVEAKTEKERADDLQEELNDLNYKHEDLLERSLERKYKLAEEKERADMAYLAYKGLAADNVSLGEYESLLDKHTAMTKAYRAEKERADKLREAIQTAIEMKELNPEQMETDQKGLYDAAMWFLSGIMDSLYPKEETK